MISIKSLKLNKNCTHDKLVDYGFKKYGMIYKLTIPLYTYKDTPTISVSFLISTLDNYVGYDVIDNNSEMIYSPYYSPEYSGGRNNIVLRTIKRRLNKILNELTDNEIIYDDMNKITTGEYKKDNQVSSDLNLDSNFIEKQVKSYSKLLKTGIVDIALKKK